MNGHGAMIPSGRNCTYHPRTCVAGGGNGRYFRARNTMSLTRLKPPAHQVRRAHADNRMQGPHPRLLFAYNRFHTHAYDEHSNLALYAPASRSSGWWKKNAAWARNKESAASHGKSLHPTGPGPNWQDRSPRTGRAGCRTWLAAGNWHSFQWGG